MDDLATRLARIRDGSQPDWDDGRVELALVRFSRARRRRVGYRAAGALAVGLIICGSYWLGTRERDHAGPRAAGVAPSGPQAARPSAGLKPTGSPRILLGDGSLITPAEGIDQIKVKEDTAARVVVEQLRGSARFDVAPVPTRAFRVEAGLASIEVVGTAFTVDRRPDGVEVSVEHGRVRVEAAGAQVELGPGERRMFAAAPPSPTAHWQGHPEASSGVASPLAHDWRALAEAGRFEEADALLRAGASVADDPEALLLAADAVRLAGHPDAALPYLQKVVDDHVSDPRAALAAFTLGRVFLNDLGQPRAAAEMFARARELSPSGSLAPDALAREVEAWHRAGEPGLAHARAEEYVRLYRGGQREAAVREYGGLE